MEFTNVIFLSIYIPIFFAIYCAAPLKMKNYCVLVFSVFVLFCGSPILFFLMFFLTGINYFFSHIFFRIKLFRLRSFCYYSLVVLNLVLFFGCSILKKNGLVFFEEDLINDIFKSLFFMANISYILDLCGKRCEIQSKVSDYFLYVFMFPKIILGPAVCYYKISNFNHFRC